MTLQHHIRPLPAQMAEFVSYHHYGARSAIDKMGVKFEETMRHKKTGSRTPLDRSGVRLDDWRDEKRTRKPRLPLDGVELPTRPKNKAWSHPDGIRFSSQSQNKTWDPSRGVRFGKDNTTRTSPEAGESARRRRSTSRGSRHSPSNAARPRLEEFDNKSHTQGTLLRTDSLSENTSIQPMPQAFDLAPPPVVQEHFRWDGSAKGQASSDMQEKKEELNGNANSHSQRELDSTPRPGVPKESTWGRFAKTRPGDTLTAEEERQRSTLSRLNLLSNYEEINANREKYERACDDHEPISRAVHRSLRDLETALSASFLAFRNNGTGEVRWRHLHTLALTYRYHAWDLAGDLHDYRILHHWIDKIRQSKSPIVEQYLLRQRMRNLCMLKPWIRLLGNAQVMRAMIGLVIATGGRFERSMRKRTHRRFKLILGKSILFRLPTWIDVQRAFISNDRRNYPPPWAHLPGRAATWDISFINFRRSIHILVRDIGYLVYEYERIWLMTRQPGNFWDFADVRKEKTWAKTSQAQTIWRQRHAIVISLWSLRKTTDNMQRFMADNDDLFKRIHGAPSHEFWQELSRNSRSDLTSIERTSDVALDAHGIVSDNRDLGLTKPIVSSSDNACDTYLAMPNNADSESLYKIRRHVSVIDRGATAFRGSPVMLQPLQMNMAGIDDLPEKLLNDSAGNSLLPDTIATSKELHDIVRRGNGHVENVLTSPSDAVSTGSENIASSPEFLSDDFNASGIDEKCGRFSIPDYKMRTVMAKPPDTPAGSWRYSLYENEIGEHPLVHVCISIESIERIAKLFHDEPVIGFDLEWKPTASRDDPYWDKVSLIQIASEDRIALFHIARFAKDHDATEVIPPSLRQLLADPKVGKVGVNIKGDCTRMQTYLGVEVRGIFELSYLYKVVKYACGTTADVALINKRCVALATQVREHLQLPLLKDAVRVSDWTMKLTENQILYAASDAYAGLQVYLALERKRKVLDPVPPRPEYAELDLPIRLGDGRTVAESIETVKADETAAVEIVSEDENQSPEIEELARDFMDAIVVNEDDATESNSDATATSALFSMADTWATEQRRKTAPTPSAKPKISQSALRAYHVWHHQGLEVHEVCKILRSPPLQEGTVANYIRSSVVWAKLPVEQERYEKIVALVPEFLRRTADKRTSL